MSKSYNFTQTLYKKSGKKVLSWSICVLAESADLYTINVYHGQVDGKLQHTSTKIRTGKNLGRANETTIQEQAFSEAESKWNKQRDKGYTTETSGVDIRQCPLPMLAHSYSDYSHKVNFDSCYIQPKLDGMRCLAVNTDGIIKLWSRQGKPVNTAPHVIDALSLVMKPDDILDGELYVHGQRFQSQISLFKKFNPREYHKIGYHIYDCVMDGKFEDRLLIIKQKLENADHPLYLVDTYKIYNKEDIDKEHAKLVSNGYEGAILRHSDCLYKQNKRSMELLKVKSFLDKEFEIIGAYENKGKMEGMCTFLLKTEDGGEFECMPTGTESERRQYWQDYLAGKLNNKIMTVKFFEWTDSNPPVPRFPVGMCIRDYE